MYPMDEFGAIYTSGLTVFRQSEATGYALMEKPMFDVCAIAIAAYQKPKLNDKNCLSSRYSIGMRKKIETIFAIAKHHGHDSLILSAFGCGAFRNPPKHVATIFKSVIEQYAGFFKQICFAIIDDHNAGQAINPHGNYRPFLETLDSLKVEPIKYTMVDTMIGPWRILNEPHDKEIRLSNVSICNLSPCYYGGKCRDLENKQHCREYLHPPLCPSSNVCQLMNDDDHMLWFRHPNRHTSNDDNINTERHSLLPLCPWTPFHCRQHILLSESRDVESLPLDVRNHCREFQHVCPFGRQCHRASSLHWETTIHIARDMCREGDKCTKMNEENHLNLFSHPGMADIRQICDLSSSKCQDRQRLKHFVRYRHYGNYDHSSVILYHGLNNQINFIQNQQEMITRIHNYAEHLNLKTPLSISHGILKCIKSLSPVYQCSKAIFELILCHNHVMSSERIGQLTNSSVLIRMIQQDKQIRKIITQYNQTVEEHINNYIQAIVTSEYSRKTRQSQPRMTESSVTTSPYLSTTTPEKDFNKIILEEEKFLRSMLSREEIDTIRQSTKNITEVSLNLLDNPVTNDQALEKHITTVFGPHLRQTDEDIVLVFKREVMHHPDANFSIQSRTSFSDGKTFTRRPWIKDSGTSKGRLKQFYESQLHCSIKGYDYAAAAELLITICMIRRTMDIDLKTIVKYMSTVHSDQLFEGHLPELIPLDYIEEVYIPHHLFASLTPTAQVLAKTAFHDSLHIIPREVNQYQDYVNGKLIEKLAVNIDQLPSLRGTVITLPSSHLKEYVMLPFTLPQVYNQYCQNQRRDSLSDDIYIYWQSMYGDMMMVLSNEPIKSTGKFQSIRSVICYIAETPSTTPIDYHESYSYLSSGDPLKHAPTMDRSSILASSNKFHCGCNIDDYLTYCLKLEKNTGLVTLMHAGPNSMYNYEKISYRFTKSEIDLNELNYIQLSAESHQVPIRNLIVCFQPLPDFHPSFDKNFHRTHVASNQSKDDKSPSILSTLKHVVGDVIGYDFDQKKLNPCSDSINCLRQTSDDHCKKYSHPCRFSELCQNKHKESHLTHEPHLVDMCPSDTSCKRLNDPYHRARFRHTGRPDFLIPCRDQLTCRNRSSEEHRIKYSHGEKIILKSTTAVEKPQTPNKTSNISPANDSKEQPKTSYHGFHNEKISSQQGATSYEQTDPRPHSQSSTNQDRLRPSSRSGSAGYQTNDTTRYSPSSYSNEQQHSPRGIGNRRRTPCSFGTACSIRNSAHLSDYSH